MGADMLLRLKRCPSDRHRRM